jgi:hypothetical protein
MHSNRANHQLLLTVQVLAAHLAKILDDAADHGRLLLEHDLFRKPVATFRDHALEHRGAIEQTFKKVIKPGLMVSRHLPAAIGKFHVSEPTRR